MMAIATLLSRTVLLSSSYSERSRQKVHRPFVCPSSSTRTRGVSTQYSLLTQQSTSGEREREKVPTEHASVQEVETTDFGKKSIDLYLHVLVNRNRGLRHTTSSPWKTQRSSSQDLEINTQQSTGEGGSQQKKAR